MRAMEPVIEITKTEPCDIPISQHMNEIDDDQLADNNGESMEQMDTNEDSTVEIELNTFAKRILFDKYFRIILKHANTTRVDAVCNLCKNNVIVKGDLEVIARFTKHLKVCIWRKIALKCVKNWIFDFKFMLNVVFNRIVI